MENELFGIFLDMHKIKLLTEDDLIYKRAAEKNSQKSENYT